MSDKKYDISKEDAALFRSQIKGATPIHSDRVVHEKPATSGNNSLGVKKENHTHMTNTLLDPLEQSLDDNFDLSPVDANTHLFFSRSGLQHKETKRFKRGEISYQTQLDLHGLNLLQSKTELVRFVNRSQATQKRCVLLIHGRGLSSKTGHAILKSAVNHWLPQLPAVMAFSSAIAKDGGLGAVYILLRKNRAL